MNGQALKQAREQAGLTQSQVAVRIGVPVDTYRSWEHGRRNPKPEQAEALDAVLSGRASKRDEIAGLRELVNQLAGELRDATNKTAELALIVARHEAELRRLQAPQPRR